MNQSSDQSELRQTMTITHTDDIRAVTSDNDPTSQACIHPICQYTVQSVHA